MSEGAGAPRANGAAPPGGLLRFVAGFTDRQLALLVGAALFLLCAWPLALVEVPPYQDVPNHLAAATIIEHPGQYPDFVVNGFLKTNAAFYAWDHFVGRVTGALLAARLFAALVLLANALVLPQLLVAFGDRRRLLVGSLFLAPMVHNWCVALGLLDFALGLPLALLLLILIQEQRAKPSAARAAAIAVTSVLAWYAHVIPLILIHLLVLIELVLVARRSWREALRIVRSAVLPLLPGTALVLATVSLHLFGPASVKMPETVSVWLSPWDLVYNLWAEWFGAFTWWSFLPTLAPCAVLAVAALARRGERVPFFQPPAFFLLGVLYAFIPYVASYWAYANTRIAPLLWMAALVRVPPRLPRCLTIGLTACTLIYSAGLGKDFVRLDRDRAEFTAGTAYVPEHAKLLPLVFRPKGASLNTRALQQAWGYYVVAKQTSAPLVFASSRLYGVTYKTPPPPQLQHVWLEGFATRMRDPGWLCSTLRDVQSDDCESTWRHYWRDLWAVVEPRFDYLLLWDPAPITLTVIPSSYREIFRQGRLVILGRP